ncbi:MAG: serine/threonine-protein phosphatase [bacterium]|nr:serine/threonine-protein phosphatase [bacterium]
MKLQTEITLARDIHNVLVPEISQKNQWSEIVGVSQPYAEVGGDMMDVIPGREAISCIIADVSGHGVPACLVMAAFKSAVHSLLNPDHPSIDSMNRINSVLFSVKKRGMFITSAILHLNADHSMAYCIAGHLPILHFRSASKKIERLWRRQLALGIQRNYSYKPDRVKGEKGDIFLLLTDGLTEMMGDNNNEFGIRGIEELLLKYNRLPLMEIKNIILKEVSAHGTPHDDQTLLLLRCL